MRSLDASTLAGLWGAVAQARGEVRRRSSVTAGKAPVVLDLDASLIDIHSENKEGTAANYKHGFGFSPMFCSTTSSRPAVRASHEPGGPLRATSWFRPGSVLGSPRTAIAPGLSGGDGASARSLLY